MAVLGIAPELRHRAVQVADQRHGRVGADVVKDGRCLFKEQRQVVLNASRRNAIAHVLVDTALRGVALHDLAPLVPKGSTRGLVHRELTPR